ncbi:unnamed protein product [Arabidopsis thaliana]|uniref:Disease resistance R13L4/SHOC-2-like LRR domain-containing protein n=1 Tax=Arabidopsis thaliana TaxID=3702 RepID=A0A654EH03_ARATH|nr:unnamed protein product [Arabidopsis thaliana]
MLPNNLRQPAIDGNTIDSIIRNVNQVHQAIQKQDAELATRLQDAANQAIGLHDDSNEAIRLQDEANEAVELQGTNQAVQVQDADQAAGEGVEGSNMTLIRNLENALYLLKRNLKYMVSLQTDVETELNKQLASLKPVDKRLEPDGNMHTSLTNWIKHELEDVTKKLLDFISKVPSKQKKKKASPDYQDSDAGSNRRHILCLPAIHETEDLKRLSVFRQVRDQYQELSPEHQICLLSFSVFPENREVNGTMLMYWWIGEGILPVIGAENEVKTILDNFKEKKLIEPVENKRKVEPSSYKMTPFVHSSVVLISTEIGIFDIYHKGNMPTMRKSFLNKVCLVEGSSNQPEAKRRGMDADHIETVFNVSERFPDFTCKWFSKESVLEKNKQMLKVLHLGRWERTNHRIQIEMDSRRGMESLSSMRKLRFLSFQGILTIKSLSFSARKLRELIILDLRGCYNLENLPKKIHKLQNLVFLDLTGCDTLEGIPMGLALLSNLEVLKGFVVSHDRETACDLIALNRLLKLRKLSVTIDREGFGLDTLIVTINEFNALEKLKVRWGNRLSRSIINQQKKKLEHSSNPGVEHRLPRKLRKLDMQRFPHSELPEWLQPQNLNGLEKLHLRSWKHLTGFGDAPGEPTDLCRLKGFDKRPGEPTNCCVKVLRLNYLPKLKVDWIDLTELYFPKLTFLESTSTGITLSACDGDGIWRSDI